MYFWYMCTLLVCIIRVFCQWLLYDVICYCVFVMCDCDQVVVVVLQVLHHLWMDFCSVVVAVCANWYKSYVPLLWVMC